MAVSLPKSQTYRRGTDMVGLGSPTYDGPRQARKPDLLQTG
jgi:hypothetical protein